MKGGDLVKVNLGVHIDGFIAQAAHTVLVPNGKNGGMVWNGNGILW